MKAQVISFLCVLKTKTGQMISQTVNHDVLTLPPEGTPQHHLSGLMDGLQNLREGEKRRIDVPAQKAYGYYDPEKVLVCPPDRFGDRHLTMGDCLPGHLMSGQQATFRVTSISEEEVTLDANHPLAGQDLVFEIETLGVRDATPDEIGETSVHRRTPLH